MSNTNLNDLVGLIEIQPLEGENIIHHLVYKTGLLDNLIHDDCTEEEYTEYLKNHKNLYQISIDAEFGGFFSIEDSGTFGSTKTCEVHAFIPKQMRKYSKKFLISFAKFIFQMTSFEAIITTVPTHCLHVVTLLESIGFEEYEYKPSQFTINGEDIGIMSFYILKTQFGGKHGFTF